MGTLAGRDAAIAAVEAAFTDFEEEKADIYEMGKVAKVSVKFCADSLNWARKAMFSAGRSDGSCRLVFLPPADVRLPALLEVCHVLLRRRREDGLRLRPLLRRNLEEVRHRRQSRPSHRELSEVSGITKQMSFFSFFFLFCPRRLCRMLHSCHDDASRFIYLLAKPGCNYLEQEDFIPLLQVRTKEIARRSG